MRIHKRLFAILMTVLLLAVNIPDLAYAEDDIASGTSGTCEWVIDADGTLTVSAGEMGMWYVLRDVPWYDYRDYINSVVFQGPVKLKTCDYLFAYCKNIQDLDLSYLDTSEVTTMSCMFTGCTSLTSLVLSNLDTSNVTNMVHMFYDCTSLTSLDLSNFETSNVQDMNGMFRNCTALTDLDVGNFKTSNVLYMYNMFDHCESLTSLDLSNFVTSNVKNMLYLFRDCSSLTTLDISNFDTTNVLSMAGMFRNCAALTSLNVSNFDTSNVTEMSSMFYNCSSLTTLDASKFDTSNVTNMREMFSRCNKLTSLDISNFDTSNVSDMGGMFSICGSLTNLDLSNFDTSNVSKMDYMFRGCNDLMNLDVSSFDTSDVRDMQYMFYMCTSLKKIDISSFDISCTNNMSAMFGGCSELAILNIGKWTYNDTIRSYGYEPRFPAKMKDNATGTAYEIGDIIPECDHYTFVTSRDEFIEGVIEFKYHPTHKTNSQLSSVVYYSDSFFSRDNSEYDHEIATASLGMDMAGMSKSYVVEFLENCGFTNNLEQSERYDIDKKDDQDKVAYTFATKEIEGDTIIAISLRGGGYGNEWGSNGRVGFAGKMFGYHYGFNTAANDVVANIKRYCGENHIALNSSKIWISGYSRSAAVANCVGELLEKQGLINKSSLYCYTFATPRTVTEDKADKSVQGIYNIVNPLDIVTCVPLNSATHVANITTLTTVEKPWNYIRHGDTLELPSYLGTFTYKKELDGMKENFQELTNYEKEYKRINGGLLQMLLDILSSTTKSEYNYVKFLQDQVIVPAMEKYLAQEEVTDDAAIMQVISFIPGARQLLEKKGFFNFKLSEGESSAKSNRTKTSPKEFAMMKQHWPETYMAWMQTGNKPKKSSWIKSIYVQCPVDIEIYDSDNDLVARICNDAVDESIEPHLDAYVDESGAKTVLMPTDSEFNIKLIATDDGEMTYSVREYDENHEMLRKTVFSQISIHKDQVFTGTVNGELNTDSDNYALESGGEIIRADHDLRDDDLNNIEIKAEVIGDGIVMGEGSYTLGDSVILDASPSYDNEFIGWYTRNDELITKESVLAMIAEEPTTYKAKFTKANNIPVDPANSDNKKPATSVAVSTTSSKTAIGTTHKVGGNTFEVLSANTVAFTKAKNKKSVAVPATVMIDDKTFNVVQVNPKAFTAKKIRTVTIGKNVKTIRKNAFSKSKASKMVIKTRMLTKKTVKGSLKKSKIKTVQVKVGKKKENKKYIKKYKKIFTKKNAGKKVTVK